MPQTTEKINKKKVIKIWIPNLDLGLSLSHKLVSYTARGAAHRVQEQESWLKQNKNTRKQVLICV